MSESRKVVDARGLACPEPVVLTKKAIEEGGFEVLEVLVGSESARENVLRYAGHAGFAAALVGTEGPAWRIEIRAEGSR
jgi:tRNA 2-thiouridine synthesizing protein A